MSFLKLRPPEICGLDVETRSSGLDDENRQPMLAVIEPLLASVRSLLENGGGTGQHAVCFAAALPHRCWQTSDLAEDLPGIRAWLKAKDPRTGVRDIADLARTAEPAGLELVDQAEMPMQNLSFVWRRKQE
jgi:hypothetical protein